MDKPTGGAWGRRVEILILALLALAATWPLALHFTTETPGSNYWNGRQIYFETPGNLWNLWWFSHALIDLGQSPFTCTYLFYPVGADLWLHTLSPLMGTIGTVLRPLLGLVATQNVLILASLIASGVAASALAKYLGADSHGATVAGALYAFSPAALAHLYVGHFDLLCTFWMPAILLVFLRLIDATNPRNWSLPLWLGLMMAGVAYTTQYYAVYSVELVVVTSIVRWRSVCRRPVLIRLACASLIAAMCTAPIAMHFAGRGASLASRADIRRSFGDYAIEPVGLLVPSFMHPLLAAPLRPLLALINRGGAIPQETTGFLGFTVVALAVAALIRLPRIPGGEANWRLAGVIAASFLVLSFGWEAKFLGKPTGIPLPAALLAQLPIVNQARAPGRHAIVAMLGVAVLAGLGWQSITRRRWRVILVGLMAFEYWTAVPLFSTDVADVYHRLAQAPGDFAILEIPVGLRDGVQELGRPDISRVFAQTVHGRPMIDGMVARLPDDRWAAITSAPLVSVLLDPQHGVQASPAETQAYFARWHIDAIVVHTNASSRERQLVETSLVITSREVFPDKTELWWLKR